MTAMEVLRKAVRDDVWLCNGNFLNKGSVYSTAAIDTGVLNDSQRGVVMHEAEDHDNGHLLNQGAGYLQVWLLT